MNIFIDLGANNGDTIRQFRNWKHLMYIGSIVENQWRMIAFEPDPRLAEHWKQHPEKDTTFINKAAWIDDGEIEMTLAEDTISSTVMKEKEVEGETVKVKSIDFSDWLRALYDDGNPGIILKVDIEGAELPLLTKMIKDGTDDIPILTLVEWHDGKMPTYKSNKDWIWRNYRGRLVEWR